MLGGIGDVTAALDADSKDVYLYFSQYVRDGRSQGVAVARIAWADRDAPAGKASIWNDGAWLPASENASIDTGWEYPSGTPLVKSERPFHDRSGTNDVFWGPSIHWNTYLERYVMLLNRAKDDQFGQEGIYVSFSPTLAAAGLERAGEDHERRQLVSPGHRRGSRHGYRPAGGPACPLLHDGAIGTDDRVRTLSRTVRGSVWRA